MDLPTLIYLIVIALTAIGVIIYFWYKHREEHSMDNIVLCFNVYLDTDDYNRQEEAIKKICNMYRTDYEITRLGYSPSYSAYKYDILLSGARQEVREIRRNIDKVW